MTDPTTTAQATDARLLTQEQIDRLFGCDEYGCNAVIDDLKGHIDALTEQVRVLEALVREKDGFLDIAWEQLEANSPVLAQEVITHARMYTMDDARSALAALEGGGE